VARDLRGSGRRLMGHPYDVCSCGKPKTASSWRCLECYGGRRPAISRRTSFLDRVEVTPSGCWEWTRARSHDGYGVYKKLRAHRVAYELAFGPIPDGLSVLHHCDNPPCVNPARLFLGTQSDNMRDCYRKGRNHGLTAMLAARGIAS
jgi:hypothetical protein